MKIGFLIRYFKIAAGGAENYTYYLAKELAKNSKNEVHIFCSDSLEKEEIIDRIKIHRCKETLKLSYYFGFYPSLTKKLLNANLDILHVIGFGFIQNEISINKVQRFNPKLKVICTPHGPFMALRNYSLLGWFVKKIYTPILKHYIKDYNSFLEDNPYQNKWMTQEYNIPKNKIKFLPPGIPEETFKSSSKAINSVSRKFNLVNKFIVTYLGRIQKYKGLDQIIQALPGLKKFKKNICFVAMGKDAGDKRRLENMAEQLKVQENVIFTGQINDADKLAILDLSEIFIFPSDWEAFGIVVLEAMAHKNAIISSKTEGGIFLVEEDKNGLLFDYGDEKGLSAKINYLIEKDRIRKNMQNNNLLKARKFLWKDISKNLEEIYRELLK